MVRCSNCQIEGHRSDKCPSPCGLCKNDNHKKSIVIIIITQLLVLALLPIIFIVIIIIKFSIILLLLSSYRFKYLFLFIINNYD